MKTNRISIAIGCVMALNACNAPQDGETTMQKPEPPPPVVTPCGAERYSAMIGSNIAAVTLPADLLHRVLYPDSMATMDFREDRLNFHVSKDGIIEDIRCG